MLTNERDSLYLATEADLLYYDRLLPRNHPLVELLDIIPWESFLPDLESHYDRDRGRPTLPLLISVKLEFLRYWDHLSDRGVLDRVATDVALRYFVQFRVDVTLSDQTMLTRFRGHLGSEGYQQIFQRLVGFACERGLVKDRLRLKDASHIIANNAVPTTNWLKRFWTTRNIPQKGIARLASSMEMLAAANMETGMTATCWISAWTPTVN